MQVLTTTPRPLPHRYVGVLSRDVEEYVADSVVTNAWCVSARWTLAPGGVYSILAVMAEGTNHEVRPYDASDDHS